MIILANLAQYEKVSKRRLASLLVGVFVAGAVVGGIVAVDRMEAIFEYREDSEQFHLERSIMSTPVTDEQLSTIGTEYTMCVLRGGGYDVISAEELTACDQQYDDQRMTFRLKNFYANLTGE